MGPTNAAAETIIQLQQQKADVLSQIETLEAVRTRIDGTIAALEPVAEWEVDEPVEPPEDVGEAIMTSDFS